MLSNQMQLKMAIRVINNNNIVVQVVENESISNTKNLHYQFPSASQLRFFFLFFYSISVAYITMSFVYIVLQYHYTSPLYNSLFHSPIHNRKYNQRFQISYTGTHIYTSSFNLTSLNSLTSFKIRKKSIQRYESPSYTIVNTYLEADDTRRQI